MKKLFLVSALAFITGISFGQASFGIHVGGNLGLVKIKSDDVNGNAHKQDNDPKIGIKAGFVGIIPFGTVSFMPELNFVQKGFKYKNSETVFPGIISATDYKATLNYIEVPLNFAFNLPAGVFVGLGPVVSLGLSGKVKGTDTNTGFPDNNYDNKVKFDGKKDADLAANDDDYHLRRFNVGADVFAGFKSSMGLFAKVGYNYDFLNLDPNKSDSNDPSFRTSGVSLSVGYVFGGTMKKK